MNTCFLVRKPCTNKTMGIEIEGLLVRNCEQSSLFNTYQGFFYQTRDTSIIEGYPNRGAEFVSQPLPVKMLKRAISKLYSKIEADFSFNDSCGIHVHVSRKWLGKKQAAQIQEFIEREVDHEDFLKLFGRYPNSYCANLVTSGSRYVAVNLTRTDTVEFRMFASGGVAWARYCVDMATYLVENARQLNIDALLAFKDSWKE